MKKNNLTWLFASSALLVLSLTTNKVEADTTSDDNASNQKTMNSNQTIEKPNSDIILNSTNNTNIHDRNMSVSSISKETENKNSSVKSNTNIINSVNTDATVNDNDDTISSTWGTAKWTFDPSDNSLTISGGTAGAINSEPWYSSSDIGSKVKTISITGKLIMGTDAGGLFANPSLESINGLSNLDTHNVTNMESMFAETTMDRLDISTLDTTNVTNMWHLFFSSKISSLNINGIFAENCGNVTNMSYMFNGMINISKIDGLNKLNTSSATNMENMFNGDYFMKEIDLSSFNTAKVTNMMNMFNFDGYLNTLDLSTFDTNSVTEMTGMLGNMINSVGDEDASGNIIVNPGLTTLILGSNSKIEESGLDNVDNFDLVSPIYGTTWHRAKDEFGNSVQDDMQFTSVQLITQYTGEKPGTYIRDLVTGTVIVNYVDEAGNSIAESKKLSGDIGKTYETVQLPIDGYTFKDVTGNVTGTFTDTSQTVTYIYTKNPETGKNVTVKYVDEKGNEIATSKTIPAGEIGSSYDATTSDYKIDIDGYALDESKLPDNATGVFTDAAQTVTYVYSKNPNVDPTPTPNPDNPITKKDYQILKVVYTGKGQVRLLNLDGTYLNKYVKNNAEYIIWDKKTINNTLMYCIGTNNEWIPSGYSEIQRNVSVIDSPINVIYSGKGKVRLLSADGKYLDKYISNNDKYTILETKNINNRLIYRINTQDMWVPADYTYTSLDKNKQVTVNYLPNWGIAVWNEPAGKPTGELLKTGSKHQVIGYAIRDVNVWLQVGENQWLDANYLI